MISSFVSFIFFVCFSLFVLIVCCLVFMRVPLRSHCSSRPYYSAIIAVENSGNPIPSHIHHAYEISLHLTFYRTFNRLLVFVVIFIECNVQVPSYINDLISCVIWHFTSRLRIVQILYPVSKASSYRSYG